MPRRPPGRLRSSARRWRARDERTDPARRSRMHGPARQVRARPHPRRSRAIPRGGARRPGGRDRPRRPGRSRPGSPSGARRGFSSHARRRLPRRSLPPEGPCASARPTRAPAGSAPRTATPPAGKPLQARRPPHTTPRPSGWFPPGARGAGSPNPEWRSSWPNLGNRRADGLLRNRRRFGPESLRFHRLDYQASGPARMHLRSNAGRACPRAAYPMAKNN